MKSWSHFFSFLLSLILCFQHKAECTSSDTFNMKISNTSHTIKLMWEKPDKTKNDLCYRSEVHYKAHCDTEWKHAENIINFSFELTAPDMKKNYVFKVRTRLECINGDWSKWSPVKYWRNETGPCNVAKPPINIRNYLLVAVIPLASLLLLCTVKQERLRRLILPIIPDPNHTREKILNVEELQWTANFTQPSDECSIAEIEVVCENDVQTSGNTVCELEEESSQIQLTHPHAMCFELVQTQNGGVYFTYPTDAPEETTVSQCCQTISGYIVV